MGPLGWTALVVGLLALLAVGLGIMGLCLRAAHQVDFSKIGYNLRTGRFNDQDPQDSKDLSPHPEHT